MAIIRISEEIRISLEKVEAPKDSDQEHSEEEDKRKRPNDFEAGKDSFEDSRSVGSVNEQGFLCTQMINILSLMQEKSWVESLSSVSSLAPTLFGLKL